MSLAGVRPRHAGVLLGALVVLGLFVVFRTAWVSDDAFITFRTVDNVLHGYGPRWNVTERVQTYTHPLWMLLLVPVTAATANPYLGSIGLSLALTGIALGLVAWQLRHCPQAAAFAVIALIGSRAFIDFSTSGLENALSHALLAGLMALTLERTDDRRRAFVLGMLVALLGITRTDLLVVAGPIALAALCRPRRTLLPFAFGFWPLVAWEVFAVIYYGVPFPNTAYAKLATGIPQPELTHQGFVYLLDSLNRDPLTLFAIAAAIAAAPAGVAAAAPGRGASARAITRSWPVAGTLVLYLAYVVRIGGDFMSGRFLTAPLVVAVCALGRTAWPVSPIGGLAPAFAALALALSAQLPTVFVFAGEQRPSQAQLWPPSGIVDERSYYFDRTSLVTAEGFRTGWYQPDIDWQLEKLLAQHPTTVLQPTVGVVGYALGSRRHVIDTLALGDPLLARLPAKRFWRVGHYEREVPDGYVESVASGQNRIVDPQIRALYDTIRIVTRAPLFSRARWRAIWALNTRAPWPRAHERD